MVQPATAGRISPAPACPGATGSGKWALIGGAGRTVNSDAGTYPSAQHLDSVVAVAVFDEHPAENVLRQRFGSTPWRRVQTWIAVHLLPLLGAMAALFLASLIVAPAAFVYERRVTAQHEAEVEKDRIQREAHDRVFGRLEELSERVERAGADASYQLEHQLGSVASDIDATLEDLKGILGPGSEQGDDRDE